MQGEKKSISVFLGYVQSLCLKLMDGFRQEREERTVVVKKNEFF